MDCGRPVGYRVLLPSFFVFFWRVALVAEVSIRLLCEPIDLIGFMVRWFPFLLGGFTEFYRVLPSFTEFYRVLSTGERLCANGVEVR